MATEHERKECDTGDRGDMRCLLTLVLNASLALCAALQYYTQCVLEEGHINHYRSALTGSGKALRVWHVLVYISYE